MKRRMSRAFSLVELMIVVVVIAILVALLVPAGSSAWTVLRQTRCKANLGNIYKAQYAYRLATDSTMFATGVHWQQLIVPYLDDGQATLTCPESGRIRDDAGGTTEVPPPAACNLEFYIYNKSTGAIQYIISLKPDAPDSWTRATQQGDHVYFEVDDNPFKGVFTYDDIRLNVWYEGATPVKIQKLHCNETGSWNEWRHDLKYDNKVILGDWVHQGDSFEWENSDPGGWSDYGLSKGTYEMQDGTDVSRVDPRIIFILDYPYLVADYNAGGVDTDDDWDKCFISDPEAWRARYRHGDTAADWQYYQSLRHFGQANVLFCDGRVESFGPEDLAETDPLWRYIER